MDSTHLLRDALHDDESADLLKRSVKLGPDHTAIPNRAIDLIFPRLKPSEQACLLYVLRRTYGFASPTINGERKRWDRIALSQFIDGTRSGAYVLDAGTGLTRSSVVTALRALEEHGLVWVSYECPTQILSSGQRRGCGWSEASDDGAAAVEIDQKTNAARCPRCGRTASKAFALRTLTPGFIKRFLSKVDGTQWEYDPEVGHFYVAAERSEDRDATGTQLPDMRELRDKLWFPDKVELILAAAAAVNRSGKISDRRVITGFLVPTVELQDTFGRNATRYALDVIIRKGIAGQSHNRNWIGYAKACARTYVERQHGGAQATRQAQQTSTVEADLLRCAELNGKGDTTRARQLLTELLTRHLDTVTSEFEGDRALARRHLLESFKRGFEDYRAIRDYTISTDYLPDWTWEDDEINTASGS